jgi:hypothetical protein
VSIDPSSAWRAQHDETVLVARQPVDDGHRRLEHEPQALARLRVEPQDPLPSGGRGGEDDEHLVAGAHEVVVALALAGVVPGLAQRGRHEREDPAGRDAEAQVAEHERLVERLDVGHADQLPVLDRHAHDAVPLDARAEHDDVVLGAQPRSEPAAVADLARRAPDRLPRVAVDRAELARDDVVDPHAPGGRVVAVQEHGARRREGDAVDDALELARPAPLRRPGHGPGW